MGFDDFKHFPDGDCSLTNERLADGVENSGSPVRRKEAIVLASCSLALTIFLCLLPWSLGWLDSGTLSVFSLGAAAYATFRTFRKIPKR